MSSTVNSVISDEMRKKIDGYMPRYPNKQAVTLPALHVIQDEMRCVPQEAIREVADMLELHPAQVHDTLSF
jgi:NADH-quinone oxidoreductase subunit E